MAKKILITLSLALCLWSVSGSAVLAAPADQPGFVQCGQGTEAKSGETLAKTQAQDCDFQKLMAMIDNLIKWAITISTSLAAIAFAYAGWLYLSAGDNPGQITKARHVFTSVGIGFALVLSGWLIFKLIETTFLSTKPDSSGGTYGTYLK